MLEALKEFFAHSGALWAYAVFSLIIFAESGILLGFFLPGDSLLLMVGLLAAEGTLNLWLILLLGTIGAITGDSVGYMFGRKVGPSLFEREDSRFFKKQNLQRAHEFYEKYGTITIILARFVPFARTFAPILAGISKMNYRRFVTYNILGGVGWVFSVTLLGYFLGRFIPDIDKYILLVIGAVIVVSAVPAYFEYRKHTRKK